MNSEADSDSGVHPVPVFDGTEPEPEPGVPMRLHDLFFDIDGKLLDVKAWRKSYPDGRLAIKSESVLGLLVCTEFVGINHNPDPNGEPLIFETTVDHGGDIVRSEWSTTLERADYAHTWAVWVTFAVGVPWRARGLLRRLRGLL